MARLPETKRFPYSGLDFRLHGREQVSRSVSGFKCLLIEGRKPLMFVREHYMIRFCQHVCGVQTILLKCMHNYLRHGGRLFGTQLCISFPLDRIPDLLRISEPWLVEDLSSLEICLIGTMTHVDAVFRDQIKKALASYHSPISSSRESFADNVFESILGKASIKSHFCAVHEYQRYRFLSFLCETGSASMVIFVLDVGSDISGHWRNWK